MWQWVVLRTLGGTPLGCGACPALFASPSEEGRASPAPYIKARIRVRYRRLAYDHEKTIQKIYAIPELEPFLGDRLRQGR